VDRTLIRWQEFLPLGIAGIALCAIIGLPVLAVLGETITSPGDAFASLARSRLLELIAHSIAIALCTTAATLIAGVPLGVFLARGRVPFRGLMLFMHALPLALPPFVTALAAFHLFGRTGWLGSPVSAQWLFAPQGLVAILAVCFTPIITTLTWLGVRTTEASADEAARSIGGPWRTLLYVVLPQASGSILLGTIVVFVLALAELAVPNFLRVEVYSAAVFARLGGFAFAPGEAAALASPLIALSLLLWVALRANQAHRGIALPNMRAASTPLFGTSAACVSASIGGWTAAVVGTAPLVVMAAIAIEGDGFRLMTSYAGHAIGNSIAYAATVGTIVAALALIVADAVRQYQRVAAWIDAVTWMGFLLPPAVIAIGLITLWNRAATQWIYATGAIVVLALVTRYAAIGLGVTLAGARQISPTHAEAARTCGARYWRRLFYIQLPSLRNTLLGAWLLTFIFCLRDIETVALIYPPGGESLTVRLFTLEANGPPAIVAALMTVQGALTLLPLMAAALLLWRRQA
jgi:iron(III) transport system permease protein